jgi:hypothetical protein
MIGISRVVLDREAGPMPPQVRVRTPSSDPHRSGARRLADGPTGIDSPRGDGPILPTSRQTPHRAFPSRAVPMRDPKPMRRTPR